MPVPGTLVSLLIISLRNRMLLWDMALAFSVELATKLSSITELKQPCY